MKVVCPTGPVGYCQTVSPSGALATFPGRPMRDSTSDMDVPGANDGDWTAVHPASSSAASSAVAASLCGVLMRRCSLHSPYDADRRREQRIFLVARRAHAPGRGIQVDVED